MNVLLALYMLYATMNAVAGLVGGCVLCPSLDLELAYLWVGITLLLFEMNRNLAFLQRTHSLNKNGLLLLAILYLLLPNVLFLLGWFHLWFSLPLSVLLLISAFYIAFRSHRSNHATATFVFSNADAILFGMCCLLALLLTDLLGFTGHVKQAVDFAVRNPIYHTLVRESWPIFSEKGEYFIYYHSMWLPPALLSKAIHGYIEPDVILAGWVYLGMVLFAALMFTRMRGRVLLLFIILCLLGNVSELPNVPYRMMTFDGNVKPEHVSYVHFLQYLGFGTKMRYFHFWGNVVYGFNSAIPILVCMGVLVSKIAPKRYFPYVSAMIISSSPFCAVALSPLMILLLVVDRHLIKQYLCDVKIWICFPLILSCALFFLGQEASETRFIWSDSESLSRLPAAFNLLSVRLFRYAYIVLGCLIPACMLIRKRIRSNIWFLFFVTLVFFLPLVWIGRHNNEFLFKGSMCLFVVYAWFLTEEWRFSSVKKRFVLIGFLLCSCLHLGTDAKVRQWTDYSWSEDKKAAHREQSWEDHLNHPEKYEYRQFWGKVLCPVMQYEHPGSSVIK